MNQKPHVELVRARLPPYEHPPPWIPPQHVDFIETVVFFLYCIIFFSIVLYLN